MFKPFTIEARQTTAAYYTRTMDIEETIQVMEEQGFDRAEVAKWIHQLDRDRQNRALVSHGGDATIIDPTMPTVGPAGLHFSTTPGAPRLVFHSQNPYNVAYYDDFVTNDEIEHLLGLASNRFGPSLVVDSEQGSADSAGRTSQTAYIGLGCDEVVREIEARIARYFSWPVLKAEPLQVIRYAPGQEYKPHYDHFPPSTGVDSHMSTPEWQRTATLIIYLKECDVGGATCFPDLGLRFAAKRGSALFFRYGNDDLKKQTLHAGEPVQAGEKIIATKWFKTLHYVG